MFFNWDVLFFTHSLDDFGNQVGLAMLGKISVVLYCLPKLKIFLKKKSKQTEPSSFVLMKQTVYLKKISMHWCFLF